jgi:hypothetical protein
MATIQPPSPPPSLLIQLTVNVIRNLYDKLHKVAVRRGITDTEAIQQALAVYTFIDEILEKGEKFFIEDHQGRLRQVFFDRIGQEAPPELSLTRSRKVLDLLKEIYGGSR